MMLMIYIIMHQIMMYLNLWSGIGINQLKIHSIL
jgi:hypothetical protein